MNPHETVCRLILLAQATFVASQAFFISMSYLGRRQFRHIVAMGVSYTILTGLACLLLSGNPFNYGAFGVGLVAFVIGNAGLWMIREKARQTKENGGDK